MDWQAEDARCLAESLLGRVGRRWKHVQSVARVAAELVDREHVAARVTSAAWLHDIGYAEALRRTGMHAIDGAEFLAARGAPDGLVGLVGHHTGARYEARELGLTERLEQLPAPDQDELDYLTLADLVVTPSGELTTVEERVAEILRRYPEDHPVHRAVTTSGAYLIHVAERARRRLALPDKWPIGTV